MKRVFFACVTVAGLISVPPAFAFQIITGHITLLEPTYVPDKIALIMDVGNAACPAGKLLWWTNGTAIGGNLDSQAVYATMLAALLSGKKVDFFIDDNDAGCNGRALHLQAGG